MNTETIKQFLVRANRAGYANAAVKEVTEPDGSHTITYAEEDLEFHDNYFGGEPFGGREVIFFKTRPAWMMVYYGAITDTSREAAEVYAFLRKALMASPEDMPLRGPEILSEGDWRYESKTVGSFENFSGKEYIFYKNKIIFSTQYAGGLVDQ